MSGDELESKVRDHDEEIRTLKREAERTNKEMIEGMRSLHKRLSMAQEYQLRDNRLTAEDLKETLKEAAALQAIKCCAHEARIVAIEEKSKEDSKESAKRMTKHEDRTLSLENTRTFAKGMVEVLVGVPALVSVLWGLFEIIKAVRG